ncbi:DUF7660 family protein [Pseudomonas sp. TE21394]
MRRVFQSKLFRLRQQRLPRKDGKYLRPIIVRLSVFEAFVSEGCISFERVRDIQTKEDLADFVGEFREGLVLNPDDWENPDLERFLAAMEAWIRSIEMYAKTLAIVMLLALAGVLLQRYFVHRNFMSSCSAQTSLNTGLAPVLFYLLAAKPPVPRCSPWSWPERSRHQASAQRISVGS